jgi:hypothetical protein
MHFTPVRFLSATDVALERMRCGGLRVRCAGGCYEDVKAVRTHPISDPHRHIALRAPAPDAQGQEVEIGVLRDLRTLPAQARRLVEEALARRYLVHTITRIVSLTEEFGFLYWEVETDRGARSLTSPRWNRSHVIEMGARSEGRIIFDVYGNRYLIPDLEALDLHSRRRFRRYIYW